jgi:hypothetical protein
VSKSDVETKVKKSLWAKIKHKVRGKKKKAKKKRALTAYHKLYFELDPLRFQLHWMKGISEAEDEKTTIDLKRCRVSQCSFEEAKRPHAFLISDRTGRRFHIAAADYEEYEIWRTTIQTITEKPCTDPAFFGPKEEKVWKSFAQLLRQDIARCLSRFHAVRWEQVQVQILLEETCHKTEGDTFTEAPRVSVSKNKPSPVSVSNSFSPNFYPETSSSKNYTPDRFKYVARIQFEDANDMGAANCAQELCALFMEAIKTTSANFLKWRPGSCKLKSLLAAGAWKGGTLKLLTSTATSYNAQSGEKEFTRTLSAEESATSGNKSMTSELEDSDALSQDRSRLNSRVDDQEEGPYEGALHANVNLKMALEEKTPKTFYNMRRRIHACPYVLGNTSLILIAL